MSTEKHFIDTPESAFVVHPNACELGLHDALLCVVNRAQGVLTLLVNDGEGEGFKSSHTVILNSLWALDGFFDQVEKLVVALHRVSTENAAPTSRNPLA